MGIKLMIIELGKYNSAEELLIETRTTRSQRHVCYQDGDWRASVTRVAVRMGLQGTGMWTGHKGAVTSIVQVSQALLNCKGDCRSVVHSLIGLLC